MTRTPRVHPENARVIAGVFFLCALLQGCALVVPQSADLRGNWPAGLPQRAELTEVPFFPQDEYQCGPAALATALAHVHVPVTPEDLVSQVYIPARKGSVQIEMLAAPRRYGLVSYALAPRYADVLREVAAGTPVVTLQDYGLGPLKLWHYAVVVGYDREKGELVLRSGEKRRLTMPLEVFEYTWKDSGRWAMVAVPPSRVPVTAERAQYLNAIVALEKARQPRAAAAAYTAYLERWPDELGAGIGLANAHYALGELDRAEAVLRQTLVRHPDSIVVMNNLAQTLSDAGRIDEALEVIERAAAQDGPHAAAVSETRAHILQRIQRR
jgi:tetratricopeptide (TPR) repeat protein